MQLTQIKTNKQFEQLASIASENRAERGHYTAPFYVYYAQLKNLYQRNHNYLWFLYTLNDKAVGYAILTTNDTNNAIVVYDIYITKEHRNAGAFKILFNMLYDLSMQIGRDHIIWDSELPPEVWNHILKTEPDQVTYRYRINCEKWREHNERTI